MIMAVRNFIITAESFHETIQNDIDDNYSKLIADLSSLSLIFSCCLLINLVRLSFIVVTK